MYVAELVGFVSVCLCVCEMETNVSSRTQSRFDECQRRCERFSEAHPEMPRVELLHGEDVCGGVSDCTSTCTTLWCGAPGDLLSFREAWLTADLVFCHWTCFDAPLREEIAAAAAAMAVGSVFLTASHPLESPAFVVRWHTMVHSSHTMVHSSQCHPVCRPLIRHARGCGRGRVRACVCRA
jgi:hypothetical protein